MKFFHSFNKRLYVPGTVLAGGGSEERKHTALRETASCWVRPRCRRHGRQRRWPRVQGRDSHCPGLKPLQLQRELVGGSNEVVPVMHLAHCTCLVNISFRHYQDHGHFHYYFWQGPVHTVVIYTLRSKGYIQKALMVHRRGRARMGLGVGNYDGSSRPSLWWLCAEQTGNSLD